MDTDQTPMGDTGAQEDNQQPVEAQPEADTTPAEPTSTPAGESTEENA